MTSAESNTATDLPLVSILVPTYNRERFIAETIRSALGQDHEAIEVIVTDNASTDGTWAVLESLATADPRVRIFRHESNIGPVRNWISCAAHARGQYAKFLWSDDLLDRTFVTRCLGYLANPDVAFAYTSARIFSEGEGHLQGPVQYTSLATGVHDAQTYLELALLTEQLPYSPGCALFRTADLQKNLLLDVPNRIGSVFSQHAIGNDFLIFLLTANAYKSVAVIAEPLSFFRAHAGSISSNSGAARLVLHYDVARAYFAETSQLPEALMRRLNAKLLWDRVRFKGASFGLHDTADFYPVAARRSTNYLQFAKIAATSVARRLMRRFSATPTA